MDKEKKHLIVTAGILVNDNQILCLQRNKNKYPYISYKYEFPGGKVEQGETNEEALMRELKEELDVNVVLTEENYFITVNHEYPDFIITMHGYICPVDTRKFTMTEHVDYKWLKRDALDQLDWAAADLPIVKKMRGE